MKDFVSKLTFGFLMAQFLPGAVVVFATACMYADKCRTYGGPLLCTVSEVGSFLFSNTFTMIVLGFLAIGVGMCIHGLNWAVLAWLEHISDLRHWKSVRGDLWWHKWPLWLQLLLSPIFMLVEIVWMVLRARTMDLIMNENIPEISPDRTGQFSFLQDFYLHFGQFFAHMAYASLFATVCACVCLLGRCDWSRVGLAILLYFSTSVLFQLGRVQLGSLFWAEAALIRGRPTEPHTQA